MIYQITNWLLRGMFSCMCKLIKDLKFFQLCLLYIQYLVSKIYILQGVTMPIFVSLYTAFMNQNNSVKVFCKQ